MDQLTITHDNSGSRGEYRASLHDSDHVGRLTWKAAGGARLVDHTLVPPEIGGRGIAAQLVEALISDAREQDFKIIPQCSYVAAAFRRHPEWSDLLAR